MGLVEDVMFQDNRLSVYSIYLTEHQHHKQTVRVMKLSAKILATALLCLVFAGCEPMHIDPVVSAEAGLIVKEITCCESIIVVDDCGALFQIVEAAGLDINALEAGDIIKGKVVIIENEVFSCEGKCEIKYDYPVCKLEAV